MTVRILTNSQISSKPRPEPSHRIRICLVRYSNEANFGSSQWLAYGFKSFSELNTVQLKQWLGKKNVLLRNITWETIPPKLNCPNQYSKLMHEPKRIWGGILFPYSLEKIRQFCVTDPNDRSCTLNKVNSEIEN